MYMDTPPSVPHKVLSLDVGAERETEQGGHKFGIFAILTIVGTIISPFGAPIHPRGVIGLLSLIVMSRIGPVLLALDERLVMPLPTMGRPCSPAQGSGRAPPPPSCAPSSAPSESPAGAAPWSGRLSATGANLAQIQAGTRCAFPVCGGTDHGRKQNSGGSGWASCSNQSSHQNPLEVEFDHHTETLPIQQFSK